MSVSLNQDDFLARCGLRKTEIGSPALPDTAMILDPLLSCSLGSLNVPSSIEPHADALRLPFFRAAWSNRIAG